MTRPRRKPDPGAACAVIDALLDAVADYHRISLPFRSEYDKLAAKHARAAAVAQELDITLPPLDEAGLPVWRERLADPYGSYHTCWEQEAIASPQRHEHWRKKVWAARRTVEALKGAPVGQETAEMPTIWYHRGRSYSTDGRTPLAVSAEQHNFLKTFLDRDEAHGSRDVQHSGVTNVASVAAKIARRFGRGYVRRPGRRGAGYFVRVRSLKAR